jgi:hypothetical protein
VRNAFRCLLNGAILAVGPVQEGIILRKNIVKMMMLTRISCSYQK